jgi:hypothetical protein
METSKLKKYAPVAREDFIEAVTNRAAVYGLLPGEIVPMREDGDAVVIGERAFPRSVAGQRNKLEERIEQQGFEQFIEAIAYTWFNRFVAIRYMEVHGYLSHGYRVLSHPDGESMPEVVENAERLELPGLDPDVVIDMKLDGRKDEELYRMILVAQCNELNQLMPFLFAPVRDATEQLLPENLLHTESLIRKLVAGLPEESLAEIEAVGWLYQFYISEKKDDVFAALKKGKKITPENVPAATQLFTPHWIVRYLVENSLGRLWMLNHPDSRLVEQMDYYIRPEEPTESSEDGDFLRISSPEEIKICDPACGSGHMLTYAFDLLYAIYEEQGYQATDIPRLILTHNLYGIEIDQRAGALAAFALTMKARERYRRFLTGGKVVQPNICVLENIEVEPEKLEQYFRGFITDQLHWKDYFQRLAEKWSRSGAFQRYRSRLITTDVALNLVERLQLQGVLAEQLGDLKLGDTRRKALDDHFKGGGDWESLSLSEQEQIADSIFWAMCEKRELTEYSQEIHAGLLVERIFVDLVKQWKEADNFGSLIRPLVEEVSDLVEILGTEKSQNSALKTDNSLLLAGVHQKVLKALRQADYLSPKYHVVVANPPYLGTRNMNPSLKGFLGSNYDDAKSDLFSAFMLRNRELAIDAGAVAMITMQSWMFLSSYAALREDILGTATILSMLHLGERGFDTIGGAVVSTTAFVLSSKYLPDYVGTYVRLTEGQSEREKQAEFHNGSASRFRCRAKSLDRVPGSPIAYWASEAIRDCFANNERLGDRVESRHGLVTAANELFVRYWHEVSSDRTGFGCKSREEAQETKCKWFPYLKGGAFRRWYGNSEHVVDWENDGKRMMSRKHPSGRIWATNFNLDFIFREGISWSDIATGKAAFRYTPPGHLFDAKSPTAFNDDECVLFSALGLVNSKLAQTLTGVLNPTVSFQAGNFDDIPYAEGTQAPELIELVRQAIRLSQVDWTSAETSWEFQSLPLLEQRRKSLEESFLEEHRKRLDRRDEMERIENSIDATLASVYQVPQDKTSDNEDTTLSAPDVSSTMREFISYAVGCMLGRYSLDKPGLILANQGETADDYRQQIPEPTFAPDEDNVIPLLDGDWFTDDISLRFEEFLRVTFGTEHYDENLKFLEDALYPDNLTGKKRKTIRDYFLKEFYNHHLKIYKKRPIYWLFSSGKQGAFRALIYMHRYNPSTLSRMRTEYVVPLQGKFNSRIEQLESDIPAASSTSHRKILERERDKLIKQRDELRTFDDKLRHYADQRIELDLDDGVKVNYGKFGDLLAEVKAITGTKPKVTI